MPAFPPTSTGMLAAVYYHIRRFGWQKGSEGYLGGPCCLQGAYQGAHILVGLMDTRWRWKIESPVFESRDGITGRAWSAMGDACQEFREIRGLSPEGGGMVGIARTNDHPNIVYRDICKILEAALAKKHGGPICGACRGIGVYLPPTVDAEPLDDRQWQHTGLRRDTVGWTCEVCNGTGKEQA